MISTSSLIITFLLSDTPHYYLLLTLICISSFIFSVFVENVFRELYFLKYFNFFPLSVFLCAHSFIHTLVQSVDVQNSRFHNKIANVFFWTVLYVFWSAQSEFQICCLEGVGFTTKNLKRFALFSVYRLYRKNYTFLEGNSSIKN